MTYPPPAWRRTQQKRNKETEKDTYIIRCGQIERTHRNKDITHNIHRQYNNIIY